MSNRYRSIEEMAEYVSQMPLGQSISFITTKNFTVDMLEELRHAIIQTGVPLSTYFFRAAQRAIFVQRFQTCIGFDNDVSVGKIVEQAKRMIPGEISTFYFSPENSNKIIALFGISLGIPDRQYSVMLTNEKNPSCGNIALIVCNEQMQNNQKPPSKSKLSISSETTNHIDSTL